MIPRAMGIFPFFRFHLDHDRWTLRVSRHVFKRVLVDMFRVLNDGKDKLIEVEKEVETYKKENNPVKVY